MAQVLVTEEYLQDTAAAIRAKLGSAQSYTPAEMADGVRQIHGDPALGIKNIAANGTYDAETDDLEGFSNVVVDVPNTYEAGDEGKVVSGGALVAQTSLNVTRNGIYDTTVNDEVVVSVAAGSNNLVAEWDFTKSLVDSVWSMRARLNGGCTQDSSGLHFTGISQYVTLNGDGEVVTWRVDRTIVLDISSMGLQGDDTSHYTLITHDDPTTGGAYGFLYRNTGKWAMYDGNWEESDIAEKNYWGGKSLGIYISTSGRAMVYANGTLVANLSYGADFRRVVLGNGRGQSKGGQIFNTTITGCRIYNGNYYEQHG